MKALGVLSFLFFVKAWAIPTAFPPSLKFNFGKKNSDVAQKCVATPVKMHKVNGKCEVKFFTAAHCGLGEFDYLSSTFILGKVPLNPRGIVRHSGYEKFKSPGLDFARFGLRMPCDSADKLKKIKFPGQFDSVASWPEVSLTMNARVYLKTSQNVILSGIVQVKSDYPFAFKVKIDNEVKENQLVPTNEDISPGDSGSPIINEAGEMIGVLSGRTEKGSFYFSTLGVGWILSQI